MAIRTNMVEYAFTQNEAGLAAATRYDFPAITLQVDEVNSRTFRSAIVEVTCIDNAATAASVTSVLIGCKLGAAAFSDLTVTSTITNSGEHQSLFFIQDFTSYFNTNFGAGSSQTCQVGVNFGGLTTQNITVRLYITYEYDDTSATTRTKTVRIPLDSNLAALTTSLVSVGSNQIPNLSTFLPEASKVFRDMFFVVDANTGANGTTTYTHGLALDAEAVDPDGTHQAALNSAVWYRRVWKRTDMTTGATHDIKSSVTSVAGGTHNHQTVLLVVTYSYDHSASTSIMNSLMLPFNGREGYVGDSTDLTVVRHQVFIPETTPVLAQSAVYMNWAIDANANLVVKIGSGTARTYTGAAGALTCGGFSVMHRFDAGAAQGSGLSIARGLNNIDVTLNSSSTTVRHSFLDGVIYLNYTSDKHALGAGVHNHTIAAPGQVYIAGAISVKTTVSLANLVAETDYFVTGLQARGAIAAFTADVAGSLALSVKRAAGEGVGGVGLGFEPFSQRHLRTDVENGVFLWHGMLHDQFKQWPGDPSTRLALESSRVWRLDLSPLGWSSWWVSCTYHAITWTVSGTITGYTGDGSGITVDIFRSDTDEKIGSVVSTTGGAFTMPWYDNTIAVYAVARQDATHLSCSDLAVAA